MVLTRFRMQWGGLNLRIRSTARPDKRNRQTCPVCGQKLVNTYLHNGEWKCRSCWEAVQKAELETRFSCEFKRAILEE